MDIGSKILSDFICYDKYSQAIEEENRREVFSEVVDRNKAMHIDKFPELASEIEEAYKFVYSKKLLPSMRSMQFGGRLARQHNARIYNCAYLPLDSIESFSEALYILLCGCGVGFSVKSIDVNKLPELQNDVPRWGSRYVVDDTIEGWSDALKYLMEDCMLNDGSLEIDYSLIRPKGSPLSGGRVAPGPDKLRESLEKVRGVILWAKAKGQTKLKPIDCHDIMCHISNAVLSGGIRRSAMISLFDMNDMEMVSCKFPENLKGNEQRWRANNSGVFMRGRVTKEEFDRYWTLVEASNAGEPGVFLTNSWEMGTNPCAEISLNPYQFCNLVEINFSSVENQEDFEQRCRAAAFIATLQASYTDFKYLRNVWKESTEREALIGVSMTGTACAKTGIIDFAKGAEIVKETNAKTAKAISINPSARCTTIKPAGTTSILLGCSSGVHAWHDRYYLRRVRIIKYQALGQYLMEKLPDFIEESREPGKEDIEVILTIPVRASKDGITRDQESPLDLLRRIKYFYNTWIETGHRYGANTNNVSTTVSIKKGEWREIGDWMWNNQDCYNAISCFPYDDANYEQAPFESIDEETYVEMATRLYELAKDIDFKHVVEEHMAIDHRDNLACAGGSCELI